MKKIINHQSFVEFSPKSGTMKKFKFIILFLFLLIPSLVESKPMKIIKVATLEYPPFIYRENNNNKGIIYDIVIDAFRRSNVIAIVEILPVKRGLSMVEDGRVDAYFSLKRTPERINKLLFTPTPIVKQDFYIFTLNDNIKFDGKIESLSQYKIGLQCNTSYGKLIDSAIKSNILNKIDCAQNTESNMKKLLAKRVDLVISSIDVGYETLERLKIKNIKTVTPKVDSIESFIAFTKVRDNSELAINFDREFNKMKYDGTIKNIRSKYKHDVSIGY